MAPQDDLTAERAADLIQSVFLANEKQWRAWYAVANSGSAQQPTPDGVAQRLVDAIAATIKQTRQEALREAARVAIEHRDRAIREDLSGGYTAQLIAVALDRLASEGG